MQRLEHEYIKESEPCHRYLLIRMTDKFWYTLIWLSAGTLAAFFAMGMLQASYVDQQFIPVGNDAFYHARRILDTAADPNVFYQFDSRIHVPEGSWLVWPWAYDYLLGRLLGTVASTNRMAALAYIPVLWVYVNIGLLIAIAASLRLRPALTAIVGLCMAASPLTQLLHGVGMVDHHYIELTFVLLVVWLGISWLELPQKRYRSILMGMALALAPAFHTGLFVLQLPLLASLGVLWLRGWRLSLEAALLFAGSLMVGTVLILLPSGPFWDGQFFFYTLSWFHLYAAAATAIVTVFLSWQPRRPATLASLAGIGVLLTLPVLAQVLTAAAFLTGDVIRLDLIAEARSPIEMAMQPAGVARVTKLYSALVWIVPPLLGTTFWLIWREQAAARVYVMITATLGLVLLLTQYRLHYFGSFALFLAPAMIMQELLRRYPTRALSISISAGALLAIAYVPPLQGQLFARQVPAIDPYYSTSRSVYVDLEKACNLDSGIVLADHNDGHYIRYHTECSVIANNFLLTPLHEQKVREVDQLMALSPEELLASRPDIRYVFARLEHLDLRQADGSMAPASLQYLVEHNPRLVTELLFSDASPPHGYEMIAELRLDDERAVPYARAFKLSSQSVDQ